ncbi:ATP-dependent RNA helicase [Phytophthora megakarya]|uniref:ATP-dependent RNA helicase n=1 Tax=Phytophthora megakarya TaxID=4795 RepID=A0A225UFF0_9STRA|nr:ATP-dependent RNA helicase [Phytophthora megakarya]
MYSKTYPSLNPVADPAARQRLMHATAPPIISGSPIDDDLLLRAILERQLRDIEAQRGTLTRREVLAATIREHVILSEHAAAEYPTTFAAAVTSGVNL